MNMNALGVLSGVVLLALVYGGLHGLLVVTALTVAWWVVRSTRIGAAAYRKKRAQEEQDAERRKQAEQQREAERRRDEAQQREAQRKVEQEQQAKRRQAELEREAERQRQRQRERASKQSEDDDWWSVLEVAPDASADEIRFAYRRKIQRCHPDRVAGLAPEFLEVAERQTRTLNAAYADANRARRGCNAR
jgi:DnaJ-domain-containing protein 1